jgi:ribulose-phosphate 3-epimerase
MGRPVKLSASLICADLLNLGYELSVLHRGGFHFIHFDMMDGHFVPRIGLGTFFLRQITGNQPLPVDVHLMVSDPVRYIDELADAGAAIVTFHLETGKDVYQIVDRIRKRGMKVGIALQPFTALCLIEPFIEYLDLILLMAYSPGTTGQAPVARFGERIEEVDALLGKRGLHSVDIAIDGGVSEDSILQYGKRGANFFILGTSGLFIPGRTREEQIGRIQAILRQEQSALRD